MSVVKHLYRYFTLASQNHAEESMALIVKIQEMNLQKDIICSSSCILLAADLERMQIISQVSVLWWRWYDDGYQPISELILSSYTI